MQVSKPVAFLIIVLSCFACIGVNWFTCSLGSSQFFSYLDQIPLGSNVNSLSIVDQDRKMSRSTVMLWKSTTQTKPDREDIQIRLDGVTIKNEFGIFRQKALGEYRYWLRSKNRSPNFSGEISFCLERPFGNAVVVGFVFIDGKLVKKDWGYLPG